MANTIALISKYLPVLDAQYKMGAKSAILDTPEQFIRTVNGSPKKVYIAKIAMDGLANYSRSSGFVAGDTVLSWQEHEFTKDRGRALQIDNMDNEESLGMAFGRLAGEFQKQHVIPEIDAYRFSTYATNAGNKLGVTTASMDIVELFAAIDQELGDAEVEPQYSPAFISYTAYKALELSNKITRQMAVQNIGGKSVNTVIEVYNGHMLIKVPQGRFYDSFTYADGTTSGQTGGGFAPAATAHRLHLLVVSPGTNLQISKRRISRVWAPTPGQVEAGMAGVNPTADAWKFDYRVYHDAWVLDNKVNGIYSIYEALVAVAAPTITVNAETGAITLACATNGASIYYTIDGTAPSAESSAYTEPFTLEATAIVKAIAVKAGMANSAIVSKTVTVED